MRSRNRRRERGHALLLALVVLVITAASSLLVLSALLGRQREAIDEATALQLTAITDAAAARAMASLSRTGAVRRLDEPFGGGRATIEPVGSNGPLRTVLLRAEYAGKTRQIRMEVQLTPDGPRVIEWRRVAP